MLVEFLLLAAGLLILVKGADLMVNAASILAKAFNVPGFVVGIFVVALGTSFPEAVIGVYSGFARSNLLAVGDVIGSSIVNITLVIGVTVIIAPIMVDYQTIKKEILLSLAIQLILAVMMFTSWDLSRFEALLLFGGMVGFTYFIFSKTRQIAAKEFPDSPGEMELFELLKDQEVIVTPEENGIVQIQNSRTILVKKHGWRFGLGLVGMVVGAKLAVDNAVLIAVALGLAKELIGLTVIAFGTSLPEFVAGLIAVIKKEDDIALGNIIGSNIMNILLVLGLSGLISPIEFANPEIFIDVAVMVGASLLLIVPVWRHNRISKRCGFIYVSFYVLYLAVKMGILF